MCRRLNALTSPVLFAAFLMLEGPAAAQAHQLVVDCRVLPDRKVRVEGWYNSPSGSPKARQSKVKVTGPGGALVAEGTTDDDGFFTFTYLRPEPLTVIVSNPGHRGEVVIPETLLGAAGPAPEGPPGAEPSPGSGPVVSSAFDPRREQIKDVLIGVGFLLAVAAFVLSLRNARALRQLKRERGHD